MNDRGAFLCRRDRSGLRSLLAPILPESLTYPAITPAMTPETTPDIVPAVRERKESDSPAGWTAARGFDVSGHRPALRGLARVVRIGQAVTSGR